MIRRPFGLGVRRRGGLRDGGFTLIELLVVIALLTIVVGLLMYPLLGGFTFLSKGKARHEVNAATRFAMDVMTRELSNAIEVILVEPQFLVFVLPNMRTYCPEGGGHWLTDSQGQPYYSYYCPVHQTANVRHELIEPVAPMRNADGERVGVVYYVAAGAEAAGQYLARAVVPFPAPHRLQDKTAWREQIAQLTPAALTPTGEDFSIQMLRFGPTAIENEVLTPYWRGRDSDYSIYRARYPLWKPGAANYSVEIRDPVGDPVTRGHEIDARSGTVSFGVERSEAGAAVYDEENPLIPPVLGGSAGYGRIVRGTEVVIGPAADAFVRARVVSAGRPPVLGREPERREYWIDYETGKIYVNGIYAQQDPPAVFAVRFMSHQIDRDDYTVIASYQTYALLNIDLTVRKTEVESGRAAPEGILGKYQDFHISGKAKLLSVAR